jgi:hypothetical protein
VFKKKKIFAAADGGVGAFFLSAPALEAKYTNKTRSNIRLGLPLPGYKDGSDNKDAQGKFYDFFYAGLGKFSLLVYLIN